MKFKNKYWWFWHFLYAPIILVITDFILSGFKFNINKSYIIMLVSMELFAFILFSFNAPRYIQIDENNFNIVCLFKTKELKKIMILKIDFKGLKLIITMPNTNIILSPVIIDKNLKLQLQQSISSDNNEV